METQEIRCKYAREWSYDWLINNRNIQNQSGATTFLGHFEKRDETGSLLHRIALSDCFGKKFCSSKIFPVCY